MGNIDYTQVVIWGPKTGSELNYEADPVAAVVEASATAKRGLSELCASRPGLPRARVAACDIVPQTRLEDGRARPGYLVLLLIATPAVGVGGEDATILRGWIESVVTVALLELISPIRVEWIGASPVGSRRSGSV